MMNLKAKYKCRYYGEIFDTRDRSSGDYTDEGIIFKRILTPDEYEHPLRYAMPFAQNYIDNPHIGFGEFIGFETSKEE